MVINKGDNADPRYVTSKDPQSSRFIVGNGSLSSMAKEDGSIDTGKNGSPSPINLSKARVVEDSPEMKVKVAESMEEDEGCLSDGVSIDQAMSDDDSKSSHGRSL